MALVLADRVKESTTTTGTGTVTLGGAATGYQSFAVIGNGNTTNYCIAGQGTSEWEVGIGTYTSSGTTLSRTTVLASSNAGSLVNFSAGTKDVFVTYPAEKAVTTDTLAYPPAIGGTTPAAITGTVVTGSSVVASNGIVVNSQTVSANYTIDSGNNGFSAGPVTVASGVTVTVSSGSVWTIV